ncbi:hypothetical protein SAMN04487948_105381 [Halogranum amylolyticum]|uniref:Uncharacterized protein n=1 Tax=Halogranum amylolyticum TaxID=660520 RepID=A0A1H8SXW5_9EURY|nr:hypothetical protein [Halogranum amylolyticum]SEO83306.1 hypothetical protein SAMN04487948_105381 [Halogranum amylolyticum]
MSGASTTANDHSSLDTGSTALQMALGPIRFVGFWAAIALPFLYVPLLFDGIDGSRAIVFLGLLVANVVALRVGHDYRQA